MSIELILIALIILDICVFLMLFKMQFDNLRLSYTNRPYEDLRLIAFEYL